MLGLDRAPVAPEFLDHSARCTLMEILELDPTACTHLRRGACQTPGGVTFEGQQARLYHGEYRGPRGPRSSKYFERFAQAFDRRPREAPLFTSPWSSHVLRVKNLPTLSVDPTEAERTITTVWPAVQEGWTRRVPLVGLDPRTSISVLCVELSRIPGATDARIKPEHDDKRTIPTPSEG
jgi:hypothetical protein